MLAFPIIVYILIAIAVIALIFGAILGYSSIKLKVEADPIVEQIDALLPQSQCGQCGYPGCKPYAEAIANGDQITKCVPGGQPLVVKIADLLGVEVPAMDGVAEPEVKVALIHEDMCIGCTKCIQACPVDAIIGTNKAMHTVIPDLCTGCELCVAPCPTNCIEMVKQQTTTKTWNWQFDENLVIPVVNTTELQKKLVIGGGKNE
ncbi:electron transport complex subunit RsxB [Actinobacillus pleuropneumoniae]|uniref:Ion-translocating oxidoreductase complex subunit B n=4 Tax=Actinobacillus pleuropneumoniae TaxID=715 RepID=A0A223MF34_ACTPL|nr:electron transport complex subunit RsxB [Actinobacillus pleuropneumoniae]ABY68771.1 putative ferredoxin II, iron sulfur protein [Actinobacillus pleuropneumoniae serovar 3 str. JL03]ASU16086.1 Electron transport complex subunit RsxB [Actinobacillus pleuropneumoniae]AWG94582.1 electron transport complex subunit RsxB [Actinobacillus pleuropneumoniae serovar 1 str. 4074]AXA20655.1 electron transport complex subunit RsxB [Actinobacillus pleuropneumoniae]EFL79605.1 electron transport complex prot